MSSLNFSYAQFEDNTPIQKNEDRICLSKVGVPFFGVDDSEVQNQTMPLQDCTNTVLSKFNEFPVQKDDKQTPFYRQFIGNQTQKFFINQDLIEIDPLQENQQTFDKQQASPSKVQALEQQIKDLQSSLSNNTFEIQKTHDTVVSRLKEELNQTIVDLDKKEDELRNKIGIIFQLQERNNYLELHEQMREPGEREEIDSFKEEATRKYQRLEIDNLELERQIKKLKAADVQAKELEYSFRLENETLRSRLKKFEAKANAHEERANLIMDFKTPLIKGIIRSAVKEKTSQMKLNTKSVTSFKGPPKKTLNACATEKNINKTPQNHTLVKQIHKSEQLLPSFPSKQDLESHWKSNKKVHISVIDDKIEEEVQNEDGETTDDELNHQSSREQRDYDFYRQINSLLEIEKAKNPSERSILKNEPNSMLKFIRENTYQHELPASQLTPQISASSEIGQKCKISEKITVPDNLPLPTHTSILMESISFIDPEPILEVVKEQKFNSTQPIFSQTSQAASANTSDDEFKNKIDKLMSEMQSFKQSFTSSQ